MRFPRVKAEGQSFYHCVSRVVDRRFIFQSALLRLRRGACGLLPGPPGYQNSPGSVRCHL